ncbi:hypothetical protein SAMCCGM7_pC0852 (plasmid) [Sinorhizobium americanum CCGM7]|nr:hypothetical protein [Sinorhizobium americanum]APG88050.1 hypothetical protein SAMCCGM7_pC0852 [Sinorhizobium americanum CCGM7]
MAHLTLCFLGGRTPLDGHLLPSFSPSLEINAEPSADQNAAD